MKTSDSIEQQEDRKAAGDNLNSPRFSPENTQPVTQKRKRGDASRIAAWRWQPGKSANPGGRPKHDLAKEIAEAVFLNNPEMIYRAYCKMLRKGSAYAFQVLADRAFGRLRESIQHEVRPYADQTDEQIRERIRELERELGIASAPEALPPASEKNN
jgi:hypothetical protein